MLKACHCMYTVSSEEKERLREEKENRKRSLAIDKELKKSGAVFKQTIKLLLLGTGESGKSTVLKQMRIIHISKFSEQERLEKVNDIKSNIRDSVLSILDAMERLQIAFDDPSLIAAREYVYDNIDLIFTKPSLPTLTQNRQSHSDIIAHVTGSISALNHLVNNNHKNGINNHNEYNNNVITSTASSANLKSSASSAVLTNQKVEKLWDCIEELWKDGGVKRCARHGNEYHLIDSAAYFLDRIEAIRSPKYLPDEQDILRCRVLTTAISETRFQVKKVNFHIFDVGGQRDQRRKWIQCFNKVTAITYVVDISSFNMTLREDHRSNRLKESLHSFRQIWINRYLYHISIILFLNKYDIFVKKIVEEQCKLEDYFPDYKTYQQPTHIEKHLVVADEHPEVTRAKMFILEQFINITNERLEDSMEIVSRYEAKLAAMAAAAAAANEAAELGLAPPSISHQVSSYDSNYNTITSNAKDRLLSPSNQRNGAIPNTGDGGVYYYTDKWTNSNNNTNGTGDFYESKYHRQLKKSYREAREESVNGKFCIPYFTCAIDTDNIKRVFKACSHILKKEHLENSGLL